MRAIEAQVAATGAEVESSAGSVAGLGEPAAMGEEADSLAFITKLASVPVWLRPVLKPTSYDSWSVPRSKVVFLRLQQITSGEAPSWSFGEASPNDREGASVAFMA